MDTQNITAVPQPIYSPAPVSAEQFVDGIKRLSEGIITRQKIYDYLVAYEVSPEDLETYNRKEHSPDVLTVDISLRARGHEVRRYSQA